MKTPPRLDTRVRAAELTRQRDPRFLLFVGFVVAAAAIGLKSELLTPKRVWILGVALFVVALFAVTLYFRAEQQLPAPEHFIPAMLGIVALTGLSFIVPEWWKYAMAAIAFAVAFFLAGYFDYLRLRQREKPGHVIVQEAVLAVVTVGAYLVIQTSSLTLPQKVVAVFLVTALATYRSFRILGRPIAWRRAIFFSAQVSFVVALLAMAMGNYLLLIPEGQFAGMLLLAWYINRSLVRHAVEETLTLRVLIELLVLTLFLAFLFFVGIQPVGT